MAAGYANTKRYIHECNALLITDPNTFRIKLVTNGKDIQPHSEVFAFYPCAIWAADDRLGRQIKIRERKAAKAEKAAKIAGKALAKAAKRARTH